MMKFTDAVKISGVHRRKSDGALIVDARTARTGIQHYAGYEVGKPEMSVVKVYRPADEVFHTDSLASFAHRPVTNDHPPVSVTADNWKTYAVGGTGDEVVRDGHVVRVPMMVSDGTAIAAIEAGKVELSAGYGCNLDWTPGKTPEGETFDAVQRNIRINHVAIVSRGRAGHECRIGDGAVQWGVAPINVSDKEPTMTAKIVMVDGIPIEATEQSAAVIDRQTKQLADTAAKVEALQTEITARDSQIGELKAKLADASKPVDVEKLVADRVALVTAARTIDKDIIVDGLSDAAVRKAVVAKRLGDDAVKDASDAEISGMFKVIAADAAKPDPLKDAANNGKPVQNMNDNGQDAYEARIRDAGLIARGLKG